MKWSLVLPLVVLGVALMLGSLYDVLPGNETPVWVGYIIVCVVAISIWAPNHPFRHGALVGWLVTAVGGAGTLLLLPSVLPRNPALADLLARNEFDPQMMRADWYWAPLFAVPLGLVLGALTWVVTRVIRFGQRRRAGGPAAR